MQKKILLVTGLRGVQLPEPYNDHKFVILTPQALKERTIGSIVEEFVIVMLAPDLHEGFIEWNRELLSSLHASLDCKTMPILKSFFREEMSRVAESLLG